MIDFDQIKILYQLGRNLTLADARILMNASQPKSYAVGDHLIKEGAVKKEVFFIKKGLVRGYRVNDKGIEITGLVRREYQIVVSVNVILFDQPSESYYQALEPTEVFCMDYDTIQNIVAKYPKLEANRRFILLNLIKELSYRVLSVVFKSPEERYLDFVKKNPNIINRVHDKYIANILGITPVSLSRIRKRIASKPPKK